MSLQRRLIVGVVLVLSLLWALTAVWFFVDVRAELRDVLDARMASSARMVRGLIERGDLQLPRVSAAAPGPGAAVVVPKLPTELICQLWTVEGRLISAVSGGPALAGAAVPDGFSNQTVGGERWRVFALTDGGRGVRILTAERRELRRNLILDTALKLSAPFAVVLPAMVLLVWLAVRRGLVPLEQLRRSIQARSADALDPIAQRGVPPELLPMVHTLNALFSRLASAFERERRFTGDAAHELRTPLAGIKTQLQIARAAEGAIRNRALEQAEAGVDRMSRLVTQLLTLARLDSGQPPSAQPEQCEVDRVARTVLQELRPVAAQRGVELSFDGGASDRPVALPPLMLHTVIRNLIENAITHGAPGGRVAVKTQRLASSIGVEILDDGPGLSEEALARVSGRFFRAAPSELPGAGLGLSIVEAVVRRYGLQFDLENRKDAAGLVARLVLPQVSPGGRCKPHQPV